MSSRTLTRFADGCVFQVKNNQRIKHHPVKMLRAYEQPVVRGDTLEKISKIAPRAGYELLGSKKVFALALQNLLTPEDMQRAGLRWIFIMHQPIISRLKNGGEKLGWYRLTLDTAREEPQINRVQHVEGVTRRPDWEDSQIGLIFKYAPEKSN